MLRVLLSQRYATAEQSKLHGITADGGTCMLYFGTLHETQNHQALHLWIDRVDEPNDTLLASFQRRECVPVELHNILLILNFQPLS